MVLSMDTNVYEASFHLLGDFDEPKRDKAIEEIVKFVTDTLGKDGEVLGISPFEKMELAYMVKHHTRSASGSYNRYTDSWFGSMKFTALPEAISLINDALRTNDSVIRHIVFKSLEGETRFVEPVEEEVVEEEVPKVKE